MVAAGSNTLPSDNFKTDFVYNLWIKRRTKKNLIFKHNYELRITTSISLAKK